MKRKMAQRDESNAGDEREAKRATPENLDFDALGLDSRLLRAIAHLNYVEPTTIQSQAIPLALQGKDVLARSRTGTGKTAAYVLPILDNILKSKTQRNGKTGLSALVLVPTKELASQVAKSIASFCVSCSQDVQTLNLTTVISEQAQHALLATSPDVIVSTPARVAEYLDSKTIDLSGLTRLVIDEADLVLSYGYEEDFQSIAKSLPPQITTFLASATLPPEIDTLKAIFCRDPVLLDLQEVDKATTRMKQYVVKCGEDEKFVLAFAMFKLRLIHGKCIVFTGDVDRCYRLKLFLEQFGLKSCVLNSELPVNCRIHVVEEFNRNVYDIIIATDEHEVIGYADELSMHTSVESMDQSNLAGANTDLSTRKNPVRPTANKPALKPSSKAKRNHDKEYGVARGIDFHNVACVLNFDLPPSAKSYTHRTGRTARRGASGTALSFAVPKDLFRRHKMISFGPAQYDEEVLAAISASQEQRGLHIEPYHLDMAKLDGFRYRVSSALKAVTPGAIRQARVIELRQQLLNSEKLKRHLEENPDDLKFLRHDTEARAAKVQPHLKHVPEYLIPGNMAGNKALSMELSSSRLGRTKVARAKRQRDHINKRKWQKKTGSKRNPLQTFSSKA